MTSEDITIALGALADSGESVIYELQSRRCVTGRWLRVDSLPVKETMLTSVSAWSQIKTVVHRHLSVAASSTDIEALTHLIIHRAVLDLQHNYYRIVGRYEDGRPFVAGEVYSRPGVGLRIWPRRQPLSSAYGDP